MPKTHAELAQDVADARADLAHFEYLLVVLKWRCDELEKISSRLRQRLQHLGGSLPEAQWIQRPPRTRQTAQQLTKKELQWVAQIDHMRQSTKTRKRPTPK